MTRALGLDVSLGETHCGQIECCPPVDLCSFFVIPFVEVQAQAEVGGGVDVRPHPTDEEPQRSRVSIGDRKVISPLRPFGPVQNDTRDKARISHVGCSKNQSFASDELDLQAATPLRILGYAFLRGCPVPDCLRLGWGQVYVAAPVGQRSLRNRDDLADLAVGQA